MMSSKVKKEDKEDDIINPDTVSVCAQSLSHIQLLATPLPTVPQAALSMEFSRQEYWSGLPFPTPGNLPDPGIKTQSLVSSVLAGEFITTAPPGKQNPGSVQVLITFCPEEEEEMGSTVFLLYSAPLTSPLKLAFSQA